MRSAAVAAIFVGVALAGKPGSESTVYSTDYITITSCAPTVTNCPAHSTSVSTTVYPVTTSTIYATTTRTITSCAATVTNCPAHSTVLVTETFAVSTTVCPIAEASSSMKYANTTMAAPTTTTCTETEVETKSSPAKTMMTTAPASCPTYSVETISTSITTVIPTVIYSTHAIPCPTPSSGASLPAGGNGTSPTGTKSPPVVTAGASAMTGSLALAAAAGLFAVLA
jgi:hypothetical protein